MRVYNLNKMVVIRKATRENKYKDGYYEVPYVEYREDGSIKCEGTEDFSSERIKTLKNYEVVKQTGEKTKESTYFRGGRNRWAHVTDFTVSRRRDAVKIAALTYPEEVIQIRKY